MVIQLSDFEAKTLKTALEAAKEKELKNYHFFEVGSVERERSGLRLEAIHSISEKLNGAG